MSEMKTKSNHGCVAAYLGFMLLANSGVALMYFLNTDAIAYNMGGISSSLILFLGLLAILNVVASVAIMLFKKWGFFLFCGTSLIAFGVNLSLGFPLGQSLAGLVGVGILYAVLQIDMGWSQLE